MEMLGVFLYLTTTGVTVYYMPMILYGTTYETLTQIINSNALNSIQSILQQIGLIEETAKQQAQQMLTVSLVASFILIIFVISGLSALWKRKDIKKEQRSETN